jgi:hypothetical protein
MRILMKRAQSSRYYLAAAIAVITFLAYLSSLRNGFVEWDDSTYVIENPFIRSINLTFLRRAFFEFYACNWHPLTWLSHALDYSIWGLNPLGHHLTNIILHAVNTFIVVILIIRLMEARNGTAEIRQTDLYKRAAFIVGVMVSCSVFILTEKGTQKGKTFSAPCFFSYDMLYQIYKSGRQ